MIRFRTIGWLLVATLLGCSLSGCSLLIDSDQYLGTGTDGGGSDGSTRDGGTTTDGRVDSGIGDCTDCLGFCLDNVCCDRDGDSVAPAGVPSDCPSSLPEPDCDDLNPQVFPGALAICGDGVANDCLKDSPDQAPPIFNSLPFEEFAILPAQTIGESSEGDDLDRSIDIQILDPGPGAVGELRFVAVYTREQELEAVVFDGDQLIEVSTGLQAFNPAIDNLSDGVFVATRSPDLGEVRLDVVDLATGTFENAVNQGVERGLGIGVTTLEGAPAVVWGSDSGIMTGELCRASSVGTQSCSALAPGFSFLGSELRSSGPFAMAEGSTPGSYILEDGLDTYLGQFGTTGEFANGRYDLLANGNEGTVVVAVPLSGRVFLERLGCTAGASVCRPERATAVIAPDIRGAALGSLGDGMLLAVVQVPPLRGPEIVARFIPDGELDPEAGVFPLLPMDLDQPIDLIGDPELSGRSGPLATSIAFAYATSSEGGVTTYWAGALHACTAL